MTLNQLAGYSCISDNSARKVIQIVHKGEVAAAQRGTILIGSGSLVGLTSMEHNVFIYNFYPNNPKLPCNGYIYHIYIEFGIMVPISTISRWVKTIGPFKGTM